MYRMPHDASDHDVRKDPFRIVVALTMWLSLVALVVAMAIFIPRVILAGCQCSYCTAWTCLRQSFGLR